MRTVCWHCCGYCGLVAPREHWSWQQFVPGAYGISGALDATNAVAAVTTAVAYRLELAAPSVAQKHRQRSLYNLVLIPLD